MRGICPPPSLRPHRVLCAGALLIVGAAQAQFGASVAVESDHLFRGVSLSDGRPDLRLSIGYDHDSGVFAGAAATRVEFVRGRHSMQLLGYAGFVTRSAAGFGVEFGATSSTFSGNTRYDYSEVFVGVSSERWSLRAYYAPDYFGFGQTTAYVELDANRPLDSRLRLFGHVGALTALGGSAIEDGRRTRADARVGIGLRLVDAVDLQLAWVTASRGGPYVVEYGSRRDAVVLSLLASF